MERPNTNPLGLMAFAVTTMTLMFVETGWVRNDDFKDLVSCSALFFGGLVQLVAGLIDLVAGDTFGTALAGFGAYWLSWGFLQLKVAEGVYSDATTFKTGMQLYLSLWGCFALTFFSLTLRKSRCLQVTFGSATLTFFLLAAGQRNATVNKLGGYVGLVNGMAAFYTAAADMAQQTYGVAMPGMKKRLQVQ
ncbi:unnamed protein product [Phaeothamnion confervicola]